MSERGRYTVLGGENVRPCRAVVKDFLREGVTNRLVIEARPTPIPRGMTAPEGKDLAVLCARLLDEKRLRDIVIVDVGDVIQIAGHFVIATGVSPRQLQRTADFVVEKLRETGVRPYGTEGYEQGSWVLFDLGDVVVHLMLEGAREFYGLEHLWGDCQQVAWNEGKPQ